LPGFGLALGFTVAYLSAVVLIPLSALVIRAARLGLSDLFTLVTDGRVLAALRVSFGVAFAASIIDVIFGALIAWTLTRYRFPGRRIFDAAIDLPFALPTAVAGIALATLYAPNGVFGAPLAKLGLRVAFTPWGILVALTFVGLPFVVRTVQPILEELERELEEAAATLGAGRLQTLWRVALPQVAPALLTGMSLAFARGVA
jgi:sulfate/thiosulfate transport system permease protein